MSGPTRVLYVAPDTDALGRWGVTPGEDDAGGTPGSDPGDGEGGDAGAGDGPRSGPGSEVGTAAGTAGAGRVEGRTATGGPGGTGNRAGALQVVTTAEAALARLDRPAGSDGTDADAPAVDCVVSAYELPDATGVELLRAVRADRPGFPFVLVSEGSLPAVAGRALADDGVVHLPVGDREEAGGDGPATVADAVATAVAGAAGSGAAAGTGGDAAGTGAGVGTEAGPGGNDGDGAGAGPDDEAVGGPAADGTDGGAVDGAERFRSIIEQSSDVVSVLDRDCRYRYQSPSVERILGYDPDRFLGEAVFEFVHPEDRERVRTELLATVENPDRTTTVEYRFKDADGSWRIVESRGTNMLDDPVVGGLVMNTRDITDRQHREQRMNVLNRTLRHDLRNNMNVILGNVELLLREYGSDDRAETIRRTAADMLELGNKVRDIERALDSSETPRELVDLVSIVEEALSGVRRNHPELTVETDLPESEWALANRYIGSAVDDAVENAVEHNDGADPHLRVTVEDAELAGEDAVTLTIADDGPGIPEDELAVLEEGGETPLRHSSGLGLWLITWIVNESAGEVAFEESSMGGTAVRITLERADASAGIGLD